MPKRRKPTINLARFKAVARKKTQGLGFEQRVLKKHRLVAKVALLRQPWFLKLNKANQQKFRTLILDYYKKIIEAQIANKELMEKFRNEEIDKRTYFTKLYQTLGMSKVALAEAEIENFCEKNGIKQWQFDNFRDIAKKLVEELG